MRRHNPFFIKGYQGPEYFCDRKQETRKLFAAICNGRDVMLMAPRRYGKTGLIHNVFHALNDGYVPIYLYIFQMRSLAEFTSAFSSLAVSKLSTSMEKIGRGLLDFFKSCRHRRCVPQLRIWSIAIWSIEMIPAIASTIASSAYGSACPKSFTHQHYQLKVNRKCIN